MSGFCLGGARLLVGDVAVLGHLADDPVAPLGCLLLLAERVVVVRRLGQRREVGDLLDGEVLELLVEVGEARRGDAVGADAEIDLVQIELEDLVLGVGALDADGEDGFLDLALDRAVAGEQEVLGDLLRDGRGALGAAVAALHLGLDQLEDGAGDALHVETAVLVEALVLGREERGDDASSGSC